MPRTLTLLALAGLPGALAMTTAPAHAQSAPLGAGALYAVRRLQKRREDAPLA